jgi:hypothetical protein
MRTTMTIIQWWRLPYPKYIPTVVDTGLGQPLV